MLHATDKAEGEWHRDGGFQTAVSDGPRFMIVRESLYTGQHYLSTEDVAFSPTEALKGATNRDTYEYGLDNCDPIIAVAQVNLEVVQFLNVCDINTAVP